MAYPDPYNFPFFNATSVTTLAADGTISAPAYSFANETNSGWYRSAANKFGFSVAGALQFDYNITNSGTWTIPFATGLVSPVVTNEADTTTQTSIGYWAKGLIMGGSAQLGWTSGAISSTRDSGISRIGVASVGIGNGSLGDFSGTLKATTINAVTALQINGAGIPGTTLLTRAGTQSQPGNPTAPASTSTYKMQGLAGAITPTFSGNIFVTIIGSCHSTTVTAGDGILMQLSYGTGAAPSNAGNLAGTQIGAILQYVNINTVVVADAYVPFTITGIITGAALSTALWFDLAAKSIATASSIGLVNISITAHEF